MRSYHLPTSVVTMTCAKAGSQATRAGEHRLRAGEHRLISKGGDVNGKEGTSVRAQTIDDGKSGGEGQGALPAVAVGFGGHASIREAGVVCRRGLLTSR